MKNYIDFLKTRSPHQWGIMGGFYVFLVLLSYLSGGNLPVAIVSIFLGCWIGFTLAYLVDTYL